MKKLFALLILFFASAGLVQAADYTIGVLAKRGTAAFYEQWLLHGAYLREQTGQNFTLVPLKFEDVEATIKSGSVDFLLVNSAIYVELAEKYPLVPVTTVVNVDYLNRKTKEFGGVVFTSSKSDGIHNLSDAVGRPFIAVDETSFGGYYMAVREMLDQGFDIRKQASEVRFAGTHDGVVKQVIAEPGTVGTVRTDTLERMDHEGKIKMSDVKVLGAKQFADFPFVVSTNLYPEWALLRLGKTDPAVAQQVQDALVKMPADSDAARLAKIAGWIKPLDYRNVKETMDSMH